MKPFQKLAETKSPDGSIIALFRHDGAYLMRVNGVDLMSTRASNSETQLAEMACTPVLHRPQLRVLIGGLGFGFTLRAALRLLPADATITVAEIMGEVIEWNRNPEFALAHDALIDSRVELVHGDVSALLRAGRHAYDVIMLDVDNGAESLTTAGNARLYSEYGIHSAVEAMRPDGRLAYWSATPEPRFVRSLQHAGLQVESHSIRAHVTSGPYHTVIVAQARVG